MNRKHCHAVNGKVSSTYASWKGMKQRCLNPNNPQYSYYGGRGIGVDPTFLTFDSFLNIMGECPPGLTLERVRCNEDYIPSNCVWATRRDQSINRRLYGKEIKIRKVGNKFEVKTRVKGRHICMTGNTWNDADNKRSTYYYERQTHRMLGL